MEEIDKQDIQSLRNGMSDDNVGIFKKYSKEGKIAKKERRKVQHVPFLSSWEKKFIKLRSVLKRKIIFIIPKTNPKNNNSNFSSLLLFLRMVL